MQAFYKCPKRKLILFVVRDEANLNGRETSPEEVYNFLVGQCKNLEWKTRFVLAKHFLKAVQWYTYKLLGISQVSSLELLSFNYLKSPDNESSTILSNVDDDDIINVFI